MPHRPYQHGRRYRPCRPCCSSSRRCYHPPDQVLQLLVGDVHLGVILVLGLFPPPLVALVASVAGVLGLGGSSVARRPCRRCRRCPWSPPGSSASCRPCHRCCRCPWSRRLLCCSPALSPVSPLSLFSANCYLVAAVACVCCSPVLAVPGLVPAFLSLESPLAPCARSPRSGPAIPCPWRWRARRSCPRRQCHGSPC